MIAYINLAVSIITLFLVALPILIRWRIQYKALQEQRCREEQWEEDQMAQAIAHARSRREHKAEDQ